MQTQANYTSFTELPQAGTWVLHAPQTTTESLSIQVKLKLREYGLGHFAYLCDVLMSRGWNGGEMTAGAMAEMAGWNYRSVCRDLEKAQANDLLSQIGLIEPYSLISTKSVNKSESRVNHRPAKVYSLLDSAELDQHFGITQPEYLNVRLDTYMNYKADISQWSIVNRPGAQTVAEIMEAAQVSKNTVTAHRRIAKTTVIPQSKRVDIDRETLPENYYEYLELANRKGETILHGRRIMRGMTLEYGGIIEGFSKKGYDRHIMRGAKPEEIKLVYHMASLNYARPELKLKSARWERYAMQYTERKTYYHAPEPVEPEPVETFEQYTSDKPVLISQPTAASVGESYLDTERMFHKSHYSPELALKMLRMTCPDYELLLPEWRTQ